MNKQSGKRKAESGRRQKRKAESGKRTADGQLLASLSARTLFRFPPSAFRFGTTLIELLITITIIAILSATFLGVSNLAMESGREARTKTTIGKIHGLLMEKWNSYATRRVDVHPNILNNINNLTIQRRQKGQMLADARLIATRELMMLEMPDSWSDILLNPVGSTAWDQPRMLNAFPALRSNYLRRYERVILNKDLNDASVRKTITDNQGAECLYMIIMLATGDGEARTLFSQQDIGDTDGDGAPEFLDGWGRPIHFIRWPAGFSSRSDLMSGDADADHDPVDVFRRDQPDPTNAIRPAFVLYPSSPRVFRTFVRELDDTNPAYRLVPLIYSAGADGEADIDDQPYTGSNRFPTILDPFAIDTDTDFFVFGLPFDMNNDGDDNSLDNIHNHLQDNK